MSYGFLPAPVYIAMVLGVSIWLLVFAVRLFLGKAKLRGNGSGGEKLGAIGAGLLGLSSLCTAVARGIEEYFKQAMHLVDMLMVIAMVLGFGAFSLMVVAAWIRTRHDPPMRKVLVITLSSMVIAVLMAGAVVLSPIKH
ncbi:MAG: hypothetical protein IBX64_09530 [Actinobacteria bacterium]|nr:hypothetical protein [Actinomycetota bacterium]